MRIMRVIGPELSTSQAAGYPHLTMSSRARPPHPRGLEVQIESRFGKAPDTHLRSSRWNYNGSFVPVADMGESPSWQPAYLDTSAV